LTNFKSLLEGNPVNGVVRVNAHPAGMHTALVTALDGGRASTMKRFMLAGQTPTTSRVVQGGGLMVRDLTTQTPTDLVQRIIGNNVPFSNVSYTGAQVASGSFSGGTGIIGFEDGILLTSGSVQNVIGPNVSDGMSTNNGTPGDADLDAITPGTLDAAVLEFDFVPTTNSVSFQYVFASEEYNEYANGQFNDVFAFFLNGTNVALVPSTTIPVSINTVNGGNPFGTNSQNPQFFRNNDLGDGGGAINTELDGLTVVFSVQAKVTPNQSNHIKLAIADVSDPNLDSVVFIRSNSFVGATPTPTPTPTGDNISTRGRVETGDNVVIGGFIITGNAPRKMIIRAIGPSLVASGITDPLADPTLELHASGGSLIMANDNWRDTQQAEIEATGIPPQNDLESAIVLTLPPGSYTAIIRGRDQGIGVALLEIYDLDPSIDSKVANISTRAFVRTGDNVLIGGFMLGGGSDQRVIVRAIGPSLARAGLNNLLADPTLELRDTNGVLLSSNDDWKVPDAPAHEIKIAGLAPTDDRESALIATLAPGPYTAIVAGKNGGIGIGLVEIYNLQ